MSDVESRAIKKKNFFFLSKCICKGVNWGCIFLIIGKKCQRQMKWGGRTGKVNPKSLGETPCNLNPVFCVPPETFFLSFQCLDGGEKSQSFC